jgi:hypothetical protein
MLGVFPLLRLVLRTQPRSFPYFRGQYQDAPIVTFMAEAGLNSGWFRPNWRE